MTLSFPNPSRSYDATQHRVRFWGYDDAVEVPFFLEESALFGLDPKTRNAEEAMLATFDAARDRIYEVAGKLYAFGRRRFYVLAASDFR